MVFTVKNGTQRGAGCQKRKIGLFVMFLCTFKNAKSVRKPSITHLNHFAQPQKSVRRHLVVLFKNLWFKTVKMFPKIIIVLLCSSNVEYGPYCMLENRENLWSTF